MMNSHIVNFREGMPYGDPSAREPAAPCKVTSDSLTVFLPPLRLQTHADDDEQIEPERSHEMPINGHPVYQVPASEASSGQLCKQVRQSRNSAEHMQCVNASEKIEKRAVWIRGQV